MKNLRILFMGTPDFAVTILDKIIAEKYNVVGAVTAVDKPAGRGQKLRFSAVKEAALQHDLEVLQPTNLKSESFQEDLNRLNPNLIIVVAFRMLPKKVWNFPALGTFNLHASLLPQYRGAAPINWAIINGEEKTGVTTFFIDEKIDTGEIIAKKEIAIDSAENAGVLHDKLMHLGADLVTETLKLIQEENVKTQKQNNFSPLKTAYKLNNENTKIDWQQPAIKIYNHIRGLSPYPVAWTYLDNGNKELRCKVYSASYVIENHQTNIGTVTKEDKKLKVATQDGYIFIEEIQLPGKRKLPTKDLLNGFSLEENSKMV
ncbi:methionyl-tRNA formyltransferase [Mesonia aestuariivivens]|uniref:Methionyl-tRNA formyltransferase n=1 Tax=Mesonia aestuariivivens TaxID=2796128 RepID=A0ABS6W4J9_9FLAO|nr:methionyl-tRNA formyltransferase [Mesonia aestuariivivens]MBW2962798.1 methionyl-tRNA formyltransferase [Mesonia aestuariivivens]